MTYAVANISGLGWMAVLSSKIVVGLIVIKESLGLPKCFLMRIRGLQVTRMHSHCSTNPTRIHLILATNARMPEQYRPAHSM